MSVDNASNNSTVTANVGTGTLAVFFSPATPSVAATFSGTTAVYFDQSSPAVTDYGIDGSTKRPMRMNSDGAIKIYDLAQGTVSISGSTGTLQVFLPDTGHTLGNVGLNSIGTASTLSVFLPDTGHELGSIRSITNTIAVDNVTATGGQTMDDNYKAQRVMIVASQSNASLTVNAPSSGTFQVYLPDTGHELGSIRGNTNTLTVFIPDTGHTLGSVGINSVNTANTLSIFIPDTGHELGSVRGITNTIGINSITPSGSTIADSNFRADRVLIAGSHASSSLAVSPAGSGTFSIFIPDTSHTLGKVDQGATGTVGNSWFVNASNTASIFTTSGSTTGVSVSGVTVIAPSSSYNFKIFAFNFMSTALSSVTVKLTNGSGGSPTEFWRPLVTDPVTVTPSNTDINRMSVTPPGYLFSTGINTTLAIVLDSGSLVHYSISYIKESA